MREIERDVQYCDYRKAEPKCSVAKRIAPLATAFVKEDALLKETPFETRLVQTCSRVSQLFKELKERGAMSAFVADELLAHYEEAEKPQQFRDIFKFDDAKKYFGSFRSRMDAKIEKTPRRTFGIDRGVPGRIETFKMEAEFGVLILNGLIGCFVQSDAIDWYRQNESIGKEIAALDEKIKSIRESTTIENPTLGFIRLWVWPYIIILALALKFAKAIAGLRPGVALSTAMVRYNGNLRTTPLRALPFRGTDLPIRNPLKKEQQRTLTPPNSPGRRSNLRRAVE